MLYIDSFHHRRSKRPSRRRKRKSYEEDEDVEDDGDDGVSEDEEGQQATSSPAPSVHTDSDSESHGESGGEGATGNEDLGRGARTRAKVSYHRSFLHLQLTLVNANRSRLKRNPGERRNQGQHPQMNDHTPYFFIFMDLDLAFGYMLCCSLFLSRISTCLLAFSIIFAVQLQCNE